MVQQRVHAVRVVSHQNHAHRRFLLIALAATARLERVLQHSLLPNRIDLRLAPHEQRVSARQGMRTAAQQRRQLAHARDAHDHAGRRLLHRAPLKIRDAAHTPRVQSADELVAETQRATLHEGAEENALRGHQRAVQHGSLGGNVHGDGMRMGCGVRHEGLPE